MLFLFYFFLSLSVIIDVCVVRGERGAAGGEGINWSLLRFLTISRGVLSLEWCWELSSPRMTAHPEKN